MRLASSALQAAAHCEAGSNSEAIPWEPVPQGLSNEPWGEFRSETPRHRARTSKTAVVDIEDSSSLQLWAWEMDRFFTENTPGSMVLKMPDERMALNMSS